LTRKLRRRRGVTSVQSRTCGERGCGRRREHLHAGRARGRRYARPAAHNEDRQLLVERVESRRAADRDRAHLMRTAISGRHQGPSSIIRQIGIVPTMMRASHVRQSSGNQAAIKRQSSGNQAAIKRQSRGNQAAIKRQSRGNQVPTMRASHVRCASNPLPRGESTKRCCPKVRRYSGTRILAGFSGVIRTCGERRGGAPC
jgi:hypothetical protein